MEEKLREYAKLLIEVGLNVQKGQTLVISCPVDCAFFARLCASAAYDVGCREVVMRWSDDYLSRERFLRADDSVFDSLPLGQKEFLNGYAAEGAAYLSISARDPEVLRGVDPDRIFAWGEGLGGGVALAVSALDERGLARTAVANPLPGGLEVLSSRVRGSVLMGTSLMDTVSDPKDQFAVFNGLECDRRHIIYAKYAHERINAFENEVVDFFNQTFHSCSLA